MGNIISNIQNKIIRSDEIPIPEMKNLSDDQIKIIKQTWEIPSAKILFSLKNISGTPGFRSHANKIMNVFGISVDCLDKQGGIDEIIRLLNDMGRSHKRRGIPKRAFVELREIIIEVLSQVCHLDDEGKQAWNDFIDIVYHVVFRNTFMCVAYILSQGQEGGGRMCVEREFCLTLKKRIAVSRKKKNCADETLNRPQHPHLKQNRDLN
ncbi:CLUMA_CG000352, isoform A [Clunio marinus]|uniref:CLUMA_CG000352, isoform A n=1 Tax=Clunio marinus TaxID=568069 RepID=A0A1J1HE47_9DIPT|nr:CLUMA_CG000352, isoform A [Clunio marinus]